MHLLKLLNNNKLKKKYTQINGETAVEISVKKKKKNVRFFFLICVLCGPLLISLILSQVNAINAKMGDRQEKQPDHPQAELGLSHI